MTTPLYTYVVDITCVGFPPVRVHVRDKDEAEQLARLWRERGCVVSVEEEGFLPLG